MDSRFFVGLEHCSNRTEKALILTSHLWTEFLVLLLLIFCFKIDGIPSWSLSVTNKL